MGKKQDSLAEVLERTGLVSKKAVPFLTYQAITQSHFADEADRIYRALGGILPTFPVNFRGWDIEFAGMGVELDEQLHFNRYRAITLKSTIYASLSGFPLDAYTSYCDTFEADCLRAGKHGGKWTNSRCEKQFGQSGSRGDLVGEGASRWKQRAFYDFLKDMSPLILGMPMARIAIWDRYGKNSEAINDVLMRPEKVKTDEMLAFIHASCF